jgi:hypothetical protein
MKEQSNTFLYIFRRGADPAQMSPEQMQQNMDAWFAWINDLRSKGHFEAGEPLHSEGKVLSGTKGQTVTDGPYAEGKEEVADTSSSRPGIWSMRPNWRKGALSLKTMAPWKCGRFKRCPRLRSPCAGANSAQDPAFADELRL